MEVNTKGIAKQHTHQQL